MSLYSDTLVASLCCFQMRLVLLRGGGVHRRVPARRHVRKDDEENKMEMEMEMEMEAFGLVRDEYETNRTNKKEMNQDIRKRRACCGRRRRRRRNARRCFFV